MEFNLLERRPEARVRGVDRKKTRIDLLLTLRSCCSCSIVLVAAEGGKKDCLVGFVGGADKEPSRPRSWNGLVNVGGATGEIGVADNKSCWTGC